MNKLVFLALITMFEAMIGIWVKLTGDSVPIYTLNFYRVFFALLTVLIFLVFIDKPRFIKKELKSNLLIGFFIALQISLFNIAMSLAPVANVVIFWSTYPFFVFIFSKFYLKEKIKRFHVLVFITGLAGLIISQPLSGIDEHIIGNVISLSGGLVYAILITYLRKESDDKPSNVFWYFLFASLFLLPAVFIFGTGNLFSVSQANLFGLSYQFPPIIWVLGLGVISTGIVYILMRYMLNIMKAGVYSVFDVIISPVAAALFAFLILQQIPGTEKIIGGSILLLASFLLTIDIAKGINIRFQKILMRRN